MKLPSIKFTEWYHWKKRCEIKDSDSPGVYILAKFTRVPNGKADYLNKKIIYIGETCNQFLKRRWYQFDRSAFHHKPGHSGGHSYRRKYGDSGKNLYVSAFSVPNNLKNKRHLFIRYIERKLILDFAMKYGEQPKLNHK